MLLWQHTLRLVNCQGQFSMTPNQTSSKARPLDPQISSRLSTNDPPDSISRPCSHLGDACQQSVNAIVYVMVVLGLYILGMTIVIIKYIRTERYEARLTRLFHNLMQRDHFFRLSRRRSSLPKCVPDMQQNIEDDLPLSPIINIPDIISTIPTPDISDHMEEESKV
ncbi:uncharacterized protein CDAR_559721 [Caerostris darwini]|uniref:Uncharacterized protein n=1 Tax=Caerostris darwini TaxID=1538125 RepID=A0AAV4SHS2_9ARAC|nr:uncharacterized protein CDAR_559721 [Caerostris darwini]